MSITSTQQSICLNSRDELVCHEWAQTGYLQCIALLICLSPWSQSVYLCFPQWETACIALLICLSPWSQSVCLYLKQWGTAHISLLICLSPCQSCFFVSVCLSLSRTVGNCMYCTAYLSPCQSCFCLSLSVSVSHNGVLHVVPCFSVCLRARHVSKSLPCLCLQQMGNCRRRNVLTGPC